MTIYEWCMRNNPQADEEAGLRFLRGSARARARSCWLEGDMAGWRAAEAEIARLDKRIRKEV